MENFKNYNHLILGVMIALGVAIHVFCISYAIIKFRSSDRSIPT